MEKDLGISIMPWQSTGLTVSGDGASGPNCQPGEGRGCLTVLCAVQPDLRQVCAPQHKKDKTLMERGHEWSGKNKGMLSRCVGMESGKPRRRQN